MKMGCFSSDELSEPLISAFVMLFYCDVLPESEEPRILRRVSCSKAYEFYVRSLFLKSVNSWSLVPIRDERAATTSFSYRLICGF